MKNVLFLLLLSIQTVLAQEDPAGNSLPDTLKRYLGYGYQGASEITGTVSFLNGKQMQTIPEGNLFNQLQGLVPGLTITGSGQPGITSMGYLRGIGTVGENSPLFIIDGVPFSDISLLNPHDVKSVAVLRDASAAAIYGGRAMNGVIVIETVRPRQGFKVQYSASAGFQLPGKGTAGDVLNAEEHAQLQWLVYKNDNVNEVHPLYGSSTNPQPTLPLWAANTDWYDALTDRAFMQNHNLSVSAGSEDVHVYFGAGYYDRKGIILNTYTKRYSVRLNSEVSLFGKHLKIGENLHVASRTGNYVPESGANPILGGPYRTMSIIPVYITTQVNGITHNFQPGEFGGSGIAFRLGNTRNTVADRIRSKDDSDRDQQLAGNVYADVSIIMGLKWRTSFGGTFAKNNRITFTHATYENAENQLTPYHGSENETMKSWALTSLLDFGRSVGNHRLSAVAGIEWLRDNIGTRDLLVQNGLVEGSGDVMAKSTYRYMPGVIQGIFLNTGYSFKDKYLVNASLRRDSSDPRNPDYYPAVSAGWRISNEPFMENISWIEDFKLRVSYGKTGIIKWDLMNSVANAGFDSRFFGGKLGMSLDLFSRSGSSMRVPLPDGTGGDYSMIRSGMKNTGFEAAVDYGWSFGSVNLNADLTISTYRNEIGDGEYGSFDTGITRVGGVQRNVPGNPLYSFFGYMVEGIFSSTGEVESAPYQQGARPGFFRFEDVREDEMITPDDRTFIGNPHPSFTAGYTMDVSYKGFDIATLLYWVQGNDIYNFTRWYTDFWPSFNGQKSKRLLYESWTPANQDASVPVASNMSNFSSNTQSTSYFVEDGSYLRMKSLQIGYSINQNTLKKLKVNSLRICLQAVNLFTITRYSGLDPAKSNSENSFGIDYGGYPNVKQVLIGIEVGL